MDDKCYKDVKECENGFAVVNSFDAKSKEFSVTLFGKKKGSDAWVGLLLGKQGDAFPNVRFLIRIVVDRPQQEILTCN